MTWRETKLKYLSAAPMVNGLGEAGTYDNPTWPRYVRTTDIAGPTALRKDVFASLPPSIARKAMLQQGDILMTAAGATIGKSLTFNEDYPACFAGFLVRFRPGPAVDGRFVAYWMQSAPYWDQIQAGAVRSTIDNFSARKYKGMSLLLPPLAEQRLIANFLDEQIGHFDRMVNLRRRLIELLTEKAEQPIRQHIAESLDVVSSDADAHRIPLKRILTKVKRPPIPGGETITAFRDGQVIARSRRRTEGYTEAWTESATFQRINVGDVVIHGLDGFAGAIGTSESEGICSPVYHVCVPVDGGDPDFNGRMLRILALSGYLSLYGGSARERAVDFRNWSSFARTQVPVVEEGEQKKIGALLQQIQILEDAVTRYTSLIGERKQALITATVTGQFDISNVTRVT
jgi:type I restriction enzyme S subunit